MEEEVTQDMQKHRLKKVQEKNKRAQARYRAKQKEKMQSFEEQCHKLTDELQCVSAAYAKLEQEKTALESELRELRIAASTQGEPSHSAQPAQPTPHRPVPTGPQGWDRLSGSKESFWDRFVRAIVSKQLGEAQALEADEHPFEWKGPDEIFAIYKGLIEELSARLVANDRDHTPESQKAVVEVIHAMRLMGRTYEEGLSPSQRVEGGAGLKEEIDKAHGLPRPDIWHSVLAAMRVSPGQRDTILELRAAHLQKMGDIIRERKDIVWELQQATVMPDSASKRQATFCQAVKLSKQLQASLASEHLAKEEFFRAVSHQVLNEIQEARMLVTAFPYLVDVPAVCDLLASEPASVTSDSEEAEEPFRSHTLPAILQIPAVIDSDLTPDLYINAFAWGCDKPNGQGAPRPVFKHGVPTAGSGATGQSFGGQGSGFAPPRYLERTHNS